MNRVIVLIILLVFISCKEEDSKILKEPRVDKRTELLSIVFRLADSHEYSSKAFPLYTEKIENYFGKYKNHELIEYIQDSIKPKGVSYGTVMLMAINITEPPKMKSIVSFTENIPDVKWGNESEAKFLKLLNKFYIDTDCELFFKENEDLYHTASQRFIDIYNDIDINWYNEFYSDNINQEFIIVNALGIGGCNYGVKMKDIDSKELVYAIMGTWTTDSLDLPIYNKEDYFPTLIHEFSHSFVNPNVEKNLEILSPSGSIILKHLKKILEKQAYAGWKPMYYEALVRASVVKYLKDHNYEEEYINKQLISEINRGFIWTGELVKELDRYSNNRGKYPSFNDFMPEIAKFFNHTAENIEESILSIDARRPQMLNISQFKNGTTDVSPEVNEIQINFNKEIEVDKIEKLIVHSDGYNTPEIYNLNLVDNNKSLKIKLSLLSKKKYKIVLKGQLIKTLEGYNPKNLDNIVIDFSTK
jgi:hypothetical protein